MKRTHYSRPLVVKLNRIDPDKVMRYFILLNEKGLYESITPELKIQGLVNFEDLSSSGEYTGYIEMIELVYESVALRGATYIKLNGMYVTVRNTPSDARLVGGSGSVSDEDEYIPRKGVSVRTNFE